MIWVDLTIMALLAVCVVIGFWRGFSKTLFALGFWIFGLWVGLNFSKEFSIFLEPYIHSFPARMTAAFASLLGITLLLGWCISQLLGEVVNKTDIGFFSRLIGMVFGFVQGMVLVLLLVIMAGLTALPKDLWWQESKFLPPFQQVATLLRDHISSGITENINYQ